MEPALSIVMPSLNQGRYIARAIESVLGQGLTDVELIVVDGGSTDETLEVLRYFSLRDRRIRWFSEPDGGQSEAVNKGLRRSTGQVIGWLNSDDIYYPDSFRAVLSYFKRNPDTTVVYGEGDWIDENERFLGRHPTEKFDGQRLQESVIIPQPSCFIRRGVIDRCGLLDESLHYCMDYEYWLRLSQRGESFAYIPWVLSGTRMHEEAKTINRRRQMHAEVNDMLHRALGKVPERWLLNYAMVASGVDRELRWSTPVRAFAVLPIAFAAAWKWNRRITPATVLGWSQDVREKAGRAVHRLRSAA